MKGTALDIAYVNNTYQLGGAETVVRQLVDGVERAGHRTSLYVAEGKSYPVDDRVHPLYPRVLSRLDYSRLHGLTNTVFPRSDWTDRHFRALADSDHDLIHIHNFHGIYASLDSLAYLAKHKPVVWTFHRFWGVTGGCDHPGGCRRYLDACGSCPKVDEWPISGVDNTAEQLARKNEVLAPLPIHIVAPSQHLGNTVRESKVGRDWPVTWIPNGVDVTRFSGTRKSDAAFRERLGIQPGVTAVLIANRDFRDPLKGYSTIAASLRDVDPVGVQLVFAGSNSAWAIEQCPPAFSCVDMGYVRSRERMAELYEAADILLYSSPGENFPCVIVEAMASACCIVSTPTDGVMEQAEHGISGYLAESFSPAHLAAALSAAMSNPVQRIAFAAEGRAKAVLEFSEDAMVKSHVELYTSILAGRSTA